MGRRVTFCIALAVASAPASSYAYPQFQLSRDKTCSGCHLSPAGGGLLSENGLVTAQALSQLDDAPEFLFDKVSMPRWLAISGDFRGATGLDAAPARDFETFPMQAELEAAAIVNSFSLHVTAGLQDPQYNNTANTLFGSREHWLQWQQDPSSPDGLFVRVGRFMPVFGLRFAEHTDYDRRYGGTPLYGEAYCAAVEYIDPKFEVHATGFIADPIQTDSVERGNGATLYAEARITEATSLGVEGKIDITPDDKKQYGGITAKHWFASPGILVEGEAEIIHQQVDAGGDNIQLVGYVLGSYFFGAFMLDLGVGAYEPDVDVRYLDQEVADLDLHWFASSHLELIWTNRFQMQELGEGGLSSGYSLLQIHARL
jgi:hypothetical protein